MTAQPTYILGVSFDYHDAAAALVCDGRVVAAVQEERLSRRKHDARLPTHAIDACLSLAGIRPADLAAVAHYEDPLLKFDRICRSGLRIRNWRSFLDTTDHWLTQGKLDPGRRLADLLGIAAGRVFYGNHHKSHVGAAFYCSPFVKATVVTLDGVGEYDTVTVSSAGPDGIRKLSSTRFPDSLGLFYSALTAYLGFEVNEGEYKVMGMAAFGAPRFADQIRKMIKVDSCRVRLDQSYFNFTRQSRMPFTDRMTALLGPSRAPDSPFAVDEFSGRPAEGTEDKRFADIAASVQAVTEELIVEIVRDAIRQTGIKDVVIAGGVGLNSLANARLQRGVCDRLYVHPAAGDAGSAIGAALCHYHEVMRRPREGSLIEPYLGLAYSDSQIRHALRRYGSDEFTQHESDEALVEAAAELLADGHVLGWMQGRFEWGPRALGNRSILANPAIAGMKNRVNMSIKFREPFRPFAPATTVERAAEFFDLPGGDHEARPEFYMLSVCPVREEARARIPAVVHADGSARVQLVDRVRNPLFHALITALGKRTGIPVILNTSFNLKGEPIVSSPRDAIQTFEWSALDNLVMGRWIVRRPKPSSLLTSALAACKQKQSEKTQ